MCYGTSGHVDEPNGLVLENFTRHAHESSEGNFFFKSIIKGRSNQINAVANPHFFETVQGTFDENLRPIIAAWDFSNIPTHNILRINHYITQSYNFYHYIKRDMPFPDSEDAGRNSEWLEKFDHNEFDDGVRYRFLVKLKLKIRELNLCLTDNEFI